MARRDLPFRYLLPKVLPVVVLVVGACAGGPGASDAEEAAPRGAVAEAGRAAQVIQLHYVGDLVEPEGDLERVADLASEIRALLQFLYADVDPDVHVGTKGSVVVVVAVPEIQFRLQRHFDELRRGVHPTGI